MKILMLTPYLPYPPTSGGQVRSYNLIKNLSVKHKIILVSLIKNDQEKDYIPQLKKYCSEVKVFKRSTRSWTIGNVLRTGFSSKPFLVVRNFSAEEKNWLKEELKKESYDLIHAENFYVMPHIPKTSIPILLTEQTILYRVYQHFVESLPWYLFFLRPILAIDIWKLKYWESFYWKKADLLVAVSQEDSDHIRKLVPGKRVKIIPNGVDFNHFNQLKYKKNPFPTVLFGAANFHWMQNQEGAKILIKEIFPKIKERVKDARLWIVGKIAPKALADFSSSPDIKIQEIKDNREAYQKSWVLVAPMRSGGGSRTKLFEAMASGLPVVTTPEGIEGIPAKRGVEAVVEDDLKKLADQVISLLLDQKKARLIGPAGRKLVKENYDWSRSAAELSEFYERMGK